MRPLSLTRFELSKILARKSVWILSGVMVLLTALTLVVSRQELRDQGYYQAVLPSGRQVEQVLQDLDQTTTKMQHLPVNDTRMSLILGNRMYRDRTIIDTADRTGDEQLVSLNLASLKNNLGELRHRGQQNSFTYRSLSLQFQMWRHLPFLGAGSYMGGPEMAFSVIPAEGILIGAIVAIGLSPIFSDEYVLGMDSFLLTAKRGRRQLVTAKLLASGLYVCLISGILIGVYIAGSLTVFGARGLDYPLQSDLNFSAPFHLSLWQYLGVGAVLQLLGGLVFGLLVLLLSSITRYAMITFVVSIGILIAPDLVQRTFPMAPWAQNILRFSDIALIQVNGLFKQLLVDNVFGYPVVYPILLILLAFMVALPLAWTTYMTYGRRQAA